MQPTYTLIRRLDLGHLFLAFTGLARKHMLHTFAADVIGLGLGAHGAARLLLLLLHPRTLTLGGAAAELLAAAATAALPASHTLVAAADRRRLGRDLPMAPRALSGLWRDARASKMAAAYAAFAVLLPLTGLLYLAAPHFTLRHAYGYDCGASAQVLCQALGAGALMTVLPAALVALQRKARNGALAQSPARALNLGVLATAVGHLVVLGPVLARREGGFLLPGIVATWAGLVATAMLGLAAPELEELAERVAEAAQAQ
jgi:hypothetical protein